MRTWHEGATYETAARHVAESIQAWRSGSWYDFAITRVGSAAFLGRVGLDQLSRQGTANVGYWVRTDQADHGIATSAERLIGRFGFEDLGLRRLELFIAVENLALPAGGREGRLRGSRVFRKVVPLLADSALMVATSHPHSHSAGVLQSAALSAERGLDGQSCARRTGGNAAISSCGHRAMTGQESWSPVMMAPAARSEEIVTFLGILPINWVHGVYRRPSTRRGKNKLALRKLCYAWRYT
jgi:hypothetical protein